MERAGGRVMRLLRAIATIDVRLVVFNNLANCCVAASSPTHRQAQTEIASVAQAFVLSVVHDAECACASS